MDNLIGKTLGQYQIVQVAGKGGMAVVYKAFQPSLNRYVALKVLPDYLAQDEQFVMRFEQEARAAAALRHPNIMVIYDVGQEDNTHFIAAEYLEGVTLSQALAAQRGPLPLPRIVNIINQLASALDFAHQRGLVHRDIKPSNAFIGADDHVTLTDFGIAKALQGGAQMTRTGTMVGTPEYMSPEQAEGRPIDQRSDNYSLGVMLYQLLTGRVPFQAETPTAVLLAHLTQAPQPPTQLNPDIPPAVEAVVMRSLAKRPEDRFPTAGELARALAQAASGAPALAYAPPTVIPGRPTRTPCPWDFPGVRTCQEQTPPPIRVPTAPQPGDAPHTPAPPPLPSQRKSGGGVKWLLWGGLATAALALVCVVGLVSLFAIRSSGGKPTAPPNVPLVTSASDTTPPSTETAPTPVASVLFDDDFQSQQASEDKGWSFEPGDYVDYVWSAGKMTVSVKKKNWLGLNWPDGDYDDFGVEIEAQPETSAYTEYGIVFRVSGSSDARSYYIFGVTTNGKYYLQKKLDGKWADPDPVSATSSQTIMPGQVKNVLRVLARGQEIQLYINGSLVNTVTDDSISSGSVGIFAGTGDNDSAAAAFSRVTVLDAEQAAASWGTQ
jgi:serine/threonine protein kinase